MTHPEMSDDPVAATSTGTVLVNVTHLTQHRELHQLLEVGKATGRQIFLGVALGPEETKEALIKLNDMSAEIVATVYRTKTHDHEDG